MDGLVRRMCIRQLSIIDYRLPTVPNILTLPPISDFFAFADFGKQTEVCRLPLDPLLLQNKHTNRQTLKKTEKHTEKQAGKQTEK